VEWNDDNHNLELVDSVCPEDTWLAGASAATAIVQETSLRPLAHKLLNAAAMPAILSGVKIANPPKTFP
jgi:hypothetical protein